MKFVKIMRFNKELHKQTDVWFRETDMLWSKKVSKVWNVSGEKIHLQYLILVQFYVFNWLYLRFHILDLNSVYCQQTLLVLDNVSKVW